MAWVLDSFHPSAEGLGLYRIFCALFILFFALPSKSIYHFIGDLPSEFFYPPPGPMMLFEGFPPEAFLLSVHCMLIAALIFLCIGLFTKTASIGAGILLLILQGFIFSLGKIDHDLLLAVIPLVMAFSGWGAAYSMDGLRKRRGNTGTTTTIAAYFPAPQGWTLTLIALITGFMFFTAGLPKILGGWLNLSTQAVEGHYVKQFFVRGRQDLLAPYVQLIGSGWWEVLDYVTIFFEVSFLVAIINPRTTRIFMCLAVLFHFGTMLILNISFVPNFIAYAAFLNWTWIDNKVNKHTTVLSASSRWRAPLLVALCMILMLVVSRVWDRYEPSLLQSDWGTEGIVIVLSALPAAIYYLSKELKNFITCAKYREPYVLKAFRGSPVNRDSRDD